MGMNIFCVITMRLVNYRNGVDLQHIRWSTLSTYCIVYSLIWRSPSQSNDFVHLNLFQQRLWLKLTANEKDHVVTDQMSEITGECYTLIFGNGDENDAMIVLNIISYLK